MEPSDTKILQEDEAVRGQIVEEGVFYHTYKEFPLKEAEWTLSAEILDNVLCFFLPQYL